MKGAPLLLLVALAGCAAPNHEHATSRPASRPSSDPGDGLARVAVIHGGLGPWAVAGLRMGQHALAELGRERGDMRVLVEHRSPAEVQWSCVADGLQAATGASAGKLTLRWTESAETSSVVRDGETGRALTFTLVESFRARYLNVPPDRLEDAAREAITLDDAEIFVVADDG